MDAKAKLGMSRENSWGDINLQTTHKPGLTDLRPASKSSNIRHLHSPRDPHSLMLKTYSSEFFEPPSLPALRAKLAAAKQLAKEQRYHLIQDPLTTPHPSQHFELGRKIKTVDINDSGDCNKDGDRDIQKLSLLLICLVRLDSAMLRFSICDLIRKAEVKVNYAISRLEQSKTQPVSLLEDSGAFCSACSVSMRTSAQNLLTNVQHVDSVVRFSLVVHKESEIIMSNISVNDKPEEKIDSDLTSNLVSVDLGILSEYLGNDLNKNTNNKLIPSKSTENNQICEKTFPKVDSKMAMIELMKWLHGNNACAYPSLASAFAQVKMQIAQSNYQPVRCLPCNQVDELALLERRIAEANSRTRSLSSWFTRRNFERVYLPVVEVPVCNHVQNIPTYHDCLTQWRDVIDRFNETLGKMWWRDVPGGINRKQNDAQLTDSWLSGGTFGSRSSVLVFRSSALAQATDADIASKPGHKLHITFRVVQAETKLLAKLLECHGINEASPDSNDYNILWTGSHPKPGILRSMAPHQRVNHFPRSYELTRKDRLYKNIEKMQHAKGLKHFDFIPQTFLMPTEYRELCTTHHRVKGPWIVKPAASSRGRGIYIVESPNQVPIEEPVVVAKYISKPLLIKGHKCDLRLYVAVTSFDPLLIYIYEEGMVRFATVKYDTTHKQLWNPCMHLCNYSINKYHSDYVKSDDPSAENVGHKWTLSALLRHLKSIGKDTAALMTQVEDLVIKAILSCGNSIVTACKMFVPNPVNCFELYGFDILIDENLKPWLLEVNLSPSLGCDSPLDVRLKSAMLSDLLTLVGIPAVDPIIKPTSPATTNSSKSLKMKISNCRRIHSADGLSNHTLPKKASKGSISLSNSSLTAEDNKMVKNAKSQFLRRGGYVRIFPSVDSWAKYGQYLDAISGIPIAGSSTSIPFSFMGQHNNNQILYKSLYPDVIITPSAQTGRLDKNFRSKRDGSLDSVRRCEAPVSTPRQDRYERKLSQGHRSTLTAPKKPLQEDYSVELKRQVCDMVRNGKKLSQVEARKAFSQYLMCVLKRISTSPDQDGHIEIVLKFLQKASTYLKNPFYVKIPGHKLSEKDRAAIVAKQLNDFLYLYNRETEQYADLDRPCNIPKNVFNEFLEHSR